MNIPIRTAVIGAGYWGQKLIRNVERCKQLRLVAVSDTDQERLEVIRHTETTLDISSLIHRADVDAIVIATPPATHFDLAHQSLQAGQHVLCEKPLALSQSDCDHLATLAAERQLCLMVDCTPVYLDEIQQARREIPWQHVDAIQCVRTAKRAPRFPGELIWSLAPHDLAILQFWLGTLPGSWNVAADSSTTVRISAEFENGATVECLFGQEDHPRREIMVKGRNISAKFQQRQTSPEPLQQVVAHFAECIQSRRQPTTTASDAAHRVKILADVVSRWY